MVRAAFIVPAYNSAKLIRSCLMAIAREKDREDEVIVVDNGSTDETGVIAREFPGVKVLACPGRSIAAVRNHGANQAGGDVICFIDSDCLVRENYRKNLDSVLSDHSVAVTGSFCDIPADSTWIERAWSSQFAKRQGPVKYINSGNLCIRRSIFVAVGGFDEQLLTDEDYDICSRIRQRGALIWADRGVSAVHLGNPKDIRSFFRRERWHATMIGLRSGRRKVDRPLLMALLFLVTQFTVLMSLLIGVRHSPLFWISLCLVPIVPLVTVIYRLTQGARLRYVGDLLLLYGVYYVARLAALQDALLGRMRKSWRG